MQDRVEQTWDDCKDWFHQIPNFYRWKQKILPDALTNFDREILEDSLRHEKHMVALIERLAAVSEFEQFSKFVSHNTLQIGLSGKSSHVNISVHWRDSSIWGDSNLYHFNTSVGKRFYIDDVPLDEAVKTISAYVQQFREIEAED